VSKPPRRLNLPAYRLPQLIIDTLRERRAIDLPAMAATALIDRRT
jgi:hypothetical protein